MRIRNSQSQNGQGLVEFALTLVILIIVVAGMIDVAPLIFNLHAAKQMSARGARAASIYAPDGIRTCYDDAVSAIGNPWLLSAAWEATVSGNCDRNPLSTIPSGQNVRVDVRVDYTPLFWRTGLWTFTTSTVDQAR